MFKEKFSFDLLREDGSARFGKINTYRGTIDTPVFMPVGTQGTIKAAFIEDVVLAGSQIILSNTYHLMIRPGTDMIKRVGGLHIRNLSKMLGIDPKTINKRLESITF